MKRLLLLAFLLSAMMITVGAQEVGIFLSARCLIAIPGIADVECGYVTVPVQYGDPSAGSMQLAVAVIRATVPQPQPDPVVYLSGGPGDGALNTIDWWVDQPFARDRDVILFDQRGTGFSKPLLICQNYDIDLNLEIIAYQMACAEALTADGIDLSAYSSAQSAQDVALMVKALGYDQVNLYGISYGTRLALTVISRKLCAPLYSTRHIRYTLMASNSRASMVSMPWISFYPPVRGMNAAGRHILIFVNGFTNG